LQRRKRNRYYGQESAEPVISERRPWKISQNLERISKNSPAYGAWNVKMVVVGTGEALLDPHPAGRRSALVYNQ
jgi:hypothetical protein